MFSLTAMGGGLGECVGDSDDSVLFVVLLSVFGLNFDVSRLCYPHFEAWVSG